MLLNRAVKLLEKVDNEILKVDSTEKKYQVKQINPLTLDELNEFLDDYYAEVSFLNENFSKAVNGNLDNYIQATLGSMDFTKLPSEITIQNKNTNRTYRAKYKQEGEELVIVQPFKEI